MDFYAWEEFFKAAGLGPNASSNYAHIFSSNKLERSHLPHLNREVLGELNISIMGHILMILKHARLVSAKNWPIGLRSPPSPIELSEEEVDDNLEPYIMPDRDTRSQAAHQDSEVVTSSAQSTSVPESTAVTDTPASASTVQLFGSVSQQEAIMERSEVTEASVSNQSEVETKASQPGTAEYSSSGNVQQLFAPKEEGSTTGPADSMNGDGPEDASESNSLLPTPVMPQNWLDPSRKSYDSGNENYDAESEMSDADEAKNSTLKNRNDSDEVKEQEQKITSDQDIAPIIPEKICSPLLPTPVMPQNWLDPCKKTDDNNFTVLSNSYQSSQSLQPMENDSSNLPVNSFESETNVNLDANYLASTSFPTFMEPPSSQPSVFISENNKQGHNTRPVFDPPGQQYAQYSDQPIQERNFQPKINPPWNKQARQTQPYYRPQPQSTYGVSSYTSLPNERYPAPGTVSTSSGYTYNSQSGGGRKEAYQWQQ